MWFVFLVLGLSQILLGKASPFYTDVNGALEKDEYLHSLKHSKEEIRAVRRILNITLENDDAADEYLSVSELITKYGYPVEEHFVETKDGYILKMHRIPPTKQGIKPCNRTVFLMHGLLTSSADWIIMGPDKSIAYHLANLGYDVWMGNSRGNTESRNHTKWSPNELKFWKFSWHEIGTKDVPAMIDYILDTTKQKALYHIGHSQGTTSFYVMCSELPEYNDKIIAHYSLAPVAYMTHAYSPLIRFISKFTGVVETLINMLGIGEFLPKSPLITFLGNSFCQAGELTEVLCKDFIFILVGFDQSEFDVEGLPIYLGHTPAGSSAMQMLHYLQLFNSGGFHQYDYSPFNALHYGPSHILSPPVYDLNKITTPVHLFHSKNDWFSNVEDVHRLCSELGNCASKTLVSEEKFNHMDFTVGLRAKEIVYKLVTDDIEKHATHETFV
ncbi:hypothetical protein WA026_015648 [Henosepilachna vigintioctopunctata]|uniref:Partial AB-hydrolase lipase domain-containing protein n=1 Tax=Henosepilachna vigintioctopunctata TaxID=420089 RepID=A0AAW1VH43_9CUCU